MATDAVLDANVQKGDSWSGAQPPFKASYGKLMMWYFLLSDAFTFAGFLISYGALRFSMASWPMPDFVFSAFPGFSGHAPLVFVTVMTFVLIASSVTMVRAVQEGHRENKKGVVFWLILTIGGGITFLSCQAWEWSTMIGKEHVGIKTNPFGTHTESGTYLDGDKETFEIGDSYLIHKHDGHWAPREFRTAEGTVMQEQFGPRAFGALFFFITGFHGFHVLSGVLFMIIIAINAGGGLYVERRNGYEMVEKIGLYWHFVDLVWVFVFLVFYLL